MRKLPAMKRRLFPVIGILLAIVMVGAVLIYLFIYNKPHPDYAEEEAEYRLTATELFSEFEAGAKEAGERYNGKVLAVTGNLTSVDTSGALTVAVFALQDGMFGTEGVRCAMIPEYAPEVRRLPEGTTITLKGYCAGFNGSDVILDHCSPAGQDKQ